MSFGVVRPMCRGVVISVVYTNTGGGAVTGWQDGYSWDDSDTWDDAGTIGTP